LDLNPLPNYPGNKGGSGVDKRLVSLMPPHRTYIEGFLGSGAVLRLKRPAELSIGLDLDPSVIKAWSGTAAPGLTLAAALAGDGVARGSTVAQVCFAESDFVRLLETSPVAPVLQDPNTLLYCDPPYLMTTRTRLFYPCEMHDPLRHALLLSLLQQLRCMVMISHYPCPLYEETLKDWRKVEYKCMTRGGPRVEACYMNFPKPQKFHDLRFVGDGFRERERIKRKTRRWLARFTAMSSEDKTVIREVLAELGPETPEMQSISVPSWRPLWVRAPEPLKGISNLQHFPFEVHISCVYFLCHHGKIVYVGSSQKLVKRLVAHLNQSRKVFDSVFYVPCKPRDLSEVEAAYIARFKPPYNGVPGLTDSDERPSPAPALPAVRVTPGDGGPRPGGLP
jgi:DNA adenine methylase